MNRVTKAQLFKGESFRAMGRVLGADGQPLTQTSVSSITCTAVSEFSSRFGPNNIDAMSTVFDPPRIDQGWTEFEGWNFLDVIPAEEFDDGLYEVVYTFTCNDDFVTKLVFNVYVKQLASS